jgi:hypothetical protein
MKVRKRSKATRNQKNDRCSMYEALVESEIQGQGLGSHTAVTDGGMIPNVYCIYTFPRLLEKIFFNF